MAIGYRDCAHCGYAYPTKNSRSRFCTDRCRAAAGRVRRNEAAQRGDEPAPVLAAAPSPLNLLAGVKDLQDLAALVAAHLSPAADVELDDEPPFDPGPAHAAGGGQLYAAVHRTLADHGREDTWAGLSALVLAGRLDDAHRETGSALKALAAGLREQMTTALSHAGAGAQPAPGDDTPKQGDQGASTEAVDQLAAARATAAARRVAFSS